MRARRAAALIGEAGTGSAAITAGSAHSRAVPDATIDHLRHAPRLTQPTYVGDGARRTQAGLP